ncbi:MAG: hypothetical protein DI598_12555 [Pseudopedobacter saltans]|uniref:Outer membrane protein beta-barrel domain-containing protein n=1 Tax=Pseudopedobacter saltans TaxID=151895 RepID=A0A2W5EPW3_9SPHI|nr:MAG: hypothetical protein DI598_12555 [Pseudopedobacter saltans]
MKKVFLALGILALVSLKTEKASAQIQKGNTMWGGTLSSFEIGLKKGQGWDLGITPRAGYFIKDNMAVGGYVNLGFSKAGSGSSVRNTYGIGAFGRLYANDNQVSSPLKHGRFFGEVNAGFGGQSQKGNPTTNGFQFGFGPGYSYFITPNVGLEGLVKYNGTVGGGNTTYQHTVTFNLGFQIYLPSSRIKSAVKDPSQL